MNENIMDGAHMARSKAIGKLNVTVIDATRRIVARGQKAGVFLGRGIDPIELHMPISALGIFNRRQPGDPSVRLIFKCAT